MGFVAQISLRLDLPLPQRDSCYSPCSWHAKRGEAVQDRGADLDICKLPIEVARCKALTEQFDTMNLCLARLRLRFLGHRPHRARPRQILGSTNDITRQNQHVFVIKRRQN